MSETKFTPGPWRAEKTRGAGLEIYADLQKALGDKYAKDFPIFGNRELRAPEVKIAYETWIQFPTERWNVMQAANAALIAAAPELYHELAYHLEMIRMTPNGEQSDDFKRMDALLKKARGEQ